MSPKLDLTVPHHPAVIDQFNKRAEDAQPELLTRSPGSRVDAVRLPAHCGVCRVDVVHRVAVADLDAGVSLEAIFLSTFVMIGQNRQARSSRRRPITISSLKSRNSRPTPT
jgi:hypothetical protein